ncbi:MAG TPA: chromosomal replication initiator DnaA [Candidatus Aminicenantes bacterium]|nr:chromosomal replication initiator DnaA [Candidatus Aminicenantes bacterium]
MARPLRIEYENAFYHVIARGERRDVIFTCPADKDKFLIKLGETAEKYRLLVHAYVLMDNHYHLLVETPYANLSRAMHYLNASYGNWFRHKYDIVGSVFQGRYKAILVEKDEYLKVLSAYIHLNPVRAGIVEEPSKYEYGSCRFYALKSKKPDFLRVDDLLGMFHGNKSEYGRFLKGYSEHGTEIDSELIYGKNSLLGSEGFLRSVFKKVKDTGGSIDDREQPDVRDMSLVNADDIMEIMLVEMRIAEDVIWKRKRGNVYRKLLIYGLWRHTANSLKQIGDIMKMDYAAVSAMVRIFKKEITENKASRQLAERLAGEVMKRRIRKT